MKFNKKQRTIMRVGATVLFCIALVLILKSIFNKNDGINNSYAGNWYMGYEIHDKESNDVLSKIERELILSNNNIFYINETIDGEKSNVNVSGKYEISNNKLILNYSEPNPNKVVTFYLDDNKICTSENCESFFVKDKLENVFIVKRSSIENEE